MEQGYSLSNIFKNTTKKQRIGFCLIVAVVVILIIILVALVMSGGSPSKDNGGEEESGDQVENVTEDTYVNEQGYTVTQKTTTYKNGEKEITGTKTDEYGNVTTIDSNLVTSYFPYQVMRQHTNEDLINSGFEYTLRYSLGLDEGGAKVINATIEYCDVEGDKALVQQYINSIPLDLSEYTINYETFTADAFCGG